MKIYFKSLSFALLLTFSSLSSLSFAQQIRDFNLDGRSTLHKSTRLLGNSVTDLKMGNLNSIWIGTGKGLNFTSDNGTTFEEYIPRDELDIGKGGVSALAVLGDIVIVANAFDDPDVEESNATGSGLTISMDNGFSWTHIDQPKDADDALFEIIFGDTIDALPIVIDVDNVTFDIAIAITEDTTIYITSFAGGVRSSTDFGATWKRIVLPPDEEDVLTDSSIHDFDLSPVNNTFFGVTGSFNHRPFSVIAWGDTVIVGTAGGINRSIDGGVSWYKFTSRNRSGISGDWAVSLHRHQWNGEETILAATRPTVAGEFLGVSLTKDGGISWRTVLRGQRVWNFASDDSVLYAAADSGLFKSVDGGITWASFSDITDQETDTPLYTQTVYSAIVMPDKRLWAGTADGLVHTDNDGFTWTILRAQKSTSEPGSVRTYSYPNPFSPARHNTFGGDGHVRFHYSLSEESTVSISVYDFSMTLVAEPVKGVLRNASEWDEVWTGRNGFGNIVANGTYFYKISIRSVSGREEALWGKVMVIE